MVLNLGKIDECEGGILEISLSASVAGLASWDLTQGGMALDPLFDSGDFFLFPSFSRLGLDWVLMLIMDERVLRAN